MINKWTNSQLVECDCNLCGLKIDEFIFERPDGLRVVQCKNCGLVYLNPRPNDDLIPVMYDSDYFSAQSQIGFDNYFSDEVRIGMLSASQRRMLVLEENDSCPFGKILEIGCATGEFCHVLHNRGLDVTGIDISEAAIAEARSRYKTIPFYVGTIDDADFEVKYDAIFAYEVIEHLIDPDTFFMKASELLEENGFLCVTTPSFECAESVGFDNWMGFSKSLEHLFFFSDATIDRYAAKHRMHVAYTLYGGGKGLNGQKRTQSLIRELVRRTLALTHLLKSVRKIRNAISPIKHDYQSEKIRHNLFMILRKGK